MHRKHLTHTALQKCWGQFTLGHLAWVTFSVASKWLESFNLTGEFSEYDYVISHDRLSLEKVQCLVLPTLLCETAAGASPHADLSTPGRSPDPFVSLADTFSNSYKLFCLSRFNFYKHCRKKTWQQNEKHGKSLHNDGYPRKGTGKQKNKSNS
jgi:hypothetical protein